MVQSSPIFHFSARYSIPKKCDKVWAEGRVPELKEFLRIIGCDNYVFQLEDSRIGKVPHNLHFQMWLHTEEKHRASALIKVACESGFSGMAITPASNAGKLILKKYCMKSDTRVAGPWADREIYMGRDLISLAGMTLPQKKLLDYLMQCDPVEHSHRLIIWICDERGASGKSAFKKFCSYHYGWPGFSYCNAKDMLYIVMKFPNKRVYFFNLSKTRSADVSENELYAALESIKDGDFTSPKYEPQNVLMNPCHVVVFANHWPKSELLSRERLKLIRWKPLPLSMVKSKFKFDWSCQGSEEVTQEEIAGYEKLLPKKRQRTTYDAPYIAPLEEIRRGIENVSI